MKRLWTLVLVLAQWGMRTADWIGDRADEVFYRFLELAQWAEERRHPLIPVTSAPEMVHHLCLLWDMTPYQSHDVEVRREGKVIHPSVVIHTDRIDLWGLLPGDEVTLLLTRGYWVDRFVEVFDPAHPVVTLSILTPVRDDLEGRR